MHRSLRYLAVCLALLCIVLAHETAAVNRAASYDETYAPITSKDDLVGTTQHFGDAEQVNAPKWGQITSLGLAVWRLLLFTFMVVKYVLRPVFYILHVLHSVARPVTLLIQLIYHITLGIPLGFTAKLFKTLYPAYLFLGSAAIIGISLGLGVSIFSRVMKMLLDHPEDETESSRLKSTSPFDTPKTKRSTGKQTKQMFPQKRSPPSNRSIMSTQSSLQTPTIFEESEASSLDSDGGYNTDSDTGMASKRPVKDYLNYKSPTQHDSLRRRK